MEPEGKVLLLMAVAAVVIPAAGSWRVEPIEVAAVVAAAT